MSNEQVLRLLDDVIKNMQLIRTMLTKKSDDAESRATAILDYLAKHTTDTDMILASDLMPHIDPTMSVDSLRCILDNMATRRLLAREWFPHGTYYHVYKRWSVREAALKFFRAHAHNEWWDLHVIREYIEEWYTKKASLLFLYLLFVLEKTGVGTTTWTVARKRLSWPSSRPSSLSWRRKRRSCAPTTRISRSAGVLQMLFNKHHHIAIFYNLRRTLRGPPPTRSRPC